MTQDINRCAKCEREKLTKLSIPSGAVGNFFKLCEGCTDQVISVLVLEHREDVVCRLGDPKEETPPAED